MARNTSATSNCRRGIPNALGSLLLVPLLLVALTADAAYSNATASDPSVPDEIGLRLWRVSHNNHTVWILGVPEAVPSSTRWRLNEAEAVIANAQQVVAQPTATLSTGLITAFRALRLWTRKSKGLENYFDAETYARFTALKAIHAPFDNRIEKLQPFMAVSRLRDAAIENSGLNQYHGIDEAVTKAAKARRVPVHHPEWSKRDSKTTMELLQSVTGAQGVTCAALVVNSLESDIERLKARASAWADGDLESLRRLAESQVEGDCMNELWQRPKDIEAAVRAEWISAVDAALEKNISTLALAPLADLLNADGSLKQLRERGYTVETPSDRVVTD